MGLLDPKPGSLSPLISLFFFLLVFLLWGERGDETTPCYDRHMLRSFVRDVMVSFPHEGSWFHNFVFYL